MGEVLPSKAFIYIAQQPNAKTTGIQAWTDKIKKSSSHHGWWEFCRALFHDRSIATAKMSMITALGWVPRGFAAPFPTKYNFDEEEFQRIAELAKLQLDDANDDLEDARKEEAGEKDPDAMDDGSDDDVPTKHVKSKG